MFHNSRVDRFEHGFGFPEHVIVPEPQHPDSLFCQVFVTSGVSPAPGVLVVLSPIQLHRQLQLMAVEVKDVGREGILPAELGIGELPASQQSPQEGLSIRGLAA